MVPVIKGNGYGYGLRRLAVESTNLGVDVIAVGTALEVAVVRESFAGDVVILNPWDAASPVAAELTGDPRVITTVSRLDDLQRHRLDIGRDLRIPHLPHVEVALDPVETDRIHPPED